MIIVDGNNVMGAKPDGWWRDRPAAVRRLLERVQCYARASGETVLLVLDRPQSDLPEGDHDGVEVRYATRKGRDAADDRIRALLAEREGVTEVVTSDRALAGDASGDTKVVGAGTFLRRLDEAGC